MNPRIEQHWGTWRLVHDAPRRNPYFTRETFTVSRGNWTDRADAEAALAGDPLGALAADDGTPIGQLTQLLLGIPEWISADEIASAHIGQCIPPFDDLLCDVYADLFDVIVHPLAAGVAASLRERAAALRAEAHEDRFAFAAGVYQTSSRPGAIGYAGEGVVTFPSGRRWRVVGHEAGGCPPGAISRSGSWWDGRIEWIPLADG
jgi:hypothetical protein